MTREQIRLGDRVEKVSGYQYPGIVVSVFNTLGGVERVAVELTIPEASGLLHIFAPEQLKLVKYETASESDAPKDGQFPNRGRGGLE